MTAGDLPSARPRRSAAAALLASLRPEQWTKNLFVFAGLLFGGELEHWSATAAAAVAFAVFCGLSGVVYLCNDLADREADRAHPLKRHRPLAAGELSTGTAVVAALLLTAVSLGATVALSPAFALVAVTYVGLLTLYSWVLKKMVILDVLAIASGFVLRAIGGAVAVNVPISQWLIICTTLLALFLALSKRRHELTLLAEGASGHRQVLQDYTPYLLDQMIGVVTASTLVTYAFYTFDAETATRLGTTRLGITVPFVLYGIFRYLYLVHQKREGGNPSALLTTDRPLLICVGLWGVSVIMLLYTPLGG